MWWWLTLELSGLLAKIGVAGRNTRITLTADMPEAEADRSREVSKDPWKGNLVSDVADRAMVGLIVPLAAGKWEGLLAWSRAGKTPNS